MKLFTRETDLNWWKPSMMYIPLQFLIYLSKCVLANLNTILFPLFIIFWTTSKKQYIFFWLLRNTFRFRMWWRFNNLLLTTVKAKRNGHNNSCRPETARVGPTYCLAAYYWSFTFELIVIWPKSFDPLVAAVHNRQAPIDWLTVHQNLQIK